MIRRWPFSRYGPLKLAVAGSDLFVVFALALLELGPPARWESGARAGALCVVLLLLPVFRILDLYKIRIWLKPLLHVRYLVAAMALLLVAYTVMLVWVNGGLATTPAGALRTVAGALTAVVARLTTVSVLFALSHNLPVLQRRSVLLGRPAPVSAFARSAAEAWLPGVVFVGSLAMPGENRPVPGGPPTLGTVDDIGRLAADGVTDAFVCWDGADQDELLALVGRCRAVGMTAHVVGPPFDAVGADAWQREYDHASVASLHGTFVRESQLVLKRVADVVGSVLLMLVLSPLLVAVALVVKLTSPGPALYVSHPVGYQRRQFRFYKFRTMFHGAPDAAHRELISKVVSDADGRYGKLVGDARITPVGGFLRRYSLDELPQLWNVLLGDMSLVGPRPSALYELDNYGPWHFKRFGVRPGMTGLWQVSGRARVSFNQMVAMDLYYIENFSLWLDFVILIRTIGVVLTGRGGY